MAGLLIKPRLVVLLCVFLFVFFPRTLLLFLSFVDELL